MRHHGILKPRSVWALRLSAVLAGLVSVYTHAMAQDGLAQNGSMLPAVSSLNASFSVEGGLYDNDEAFVALGSVTAPAGHNYGVQFDGAVGTIDGDAIIGGGFHAFRRNPESYLLGVFTSHHRWKEFEISRVAAESELYWNDFTIRTLVGLEHISLPDRIGSMTVMDREDSHLFLELDLAWYPTDNLEMFVGFHRESEAPLGVIGFEYRPLWDFRQPVSIFGVAYAGEDDYLRATAGVRIYFGDNDGRSLIALRREQDPPNHTPVSPHFTEMVFRRANNIPEGE
jgi:hypothetical protein